MKVSTSQVSTHTGSFDVVSGVLRVTDPCYGIDVHCAGIVRAAVGKWRWEVTITNDSASVAAHLSTIDPSEAEDAWEVEPFDVGVDSGVFGIFEASKYSKDDLDDVYNRSGVYELDHGIASTTGLGDGIFKCQTIKRNGIAVAVRVTSLVDDSEA